MRFSPAQRRYNRVAAVLMASYMLILFGIVHYFRGRHPAGVLAYVAAVLPALPLIGVFSAMGRYLATETDEYLRVVQIRQILVATGLALSIACVWGFLEGFGLAPHLTAWWWPTIWFLGLLVGAAVNIAVERGSR